MLPAILGVSSTCESAPASAAGLVAAIAARSAAISVSSR
jgi:hypothetical protein